MLYKKVKKGNIIIEISNGGIELVGTKPYLIKAVGTITLDNYVFIRQTYRDKDITLKYKCILVKKSKILGSTIL